MTRLTYKAANRSSIVTPQPPGSSWLSPTGHGLAMSNSRNSNTMDTDQCQVDSPKKNHHSGIVPFVKYSDETQPAKTEWHRNDLVDDDRAGVAQTEDRLRTPAKPNRCHAKQQQRPDVKRKALWQQQQNE